MAAQIQTINTGTSPNDGTGDSLRAAFIKTNQNFTSIADVINNNTVFNSANIIGALTSDSITANSAVIHNTTSLNVFTANVGTIGTLTAGFANVTSLVANTVHFTANIQNTGPGTGTLVVDGGIFASGNIYVGGGLTVAGNLQYVTSANLTVQSPIIAVGTGPGGGNPVADDGADKGLEILWYSNAAASSKISFLGQQNSTGNLVFFRDASYNGVTFTGNMGNAKFGNVYANIATTAQPYITSLGTLTSLNVAGNVTAGGYLGNVLTSSQPNITSLGNLTAFAANVSAGTLNGNLFVTGGTIYINGSPVTTAAASFPGGTVPGDAQFTSLTPSTSKTTGAVVISGGLGVGGNINVGGAFYGNLVGNILTPVQPLITTLGALGNLTVNNALTTSTLSATSISVTNFVNASTLTGLLQTAAQTNITQLGTLGSLNVSGQTSTGSLTTTNVVVTGGSINNTVIGNVTPAAGTFTTISATSATASTSTSTGAVVITGGLGVGGDLYSSTVNTTTVGASTVNVGTVNAGTLNGNISATTVGATTVNASTVNANLNATTISVTTLTATGSQQFITAANAGIEIGSTSSANTPYIDFHSSGNNIDYDVRLIASAGNATVGSGNLTIASANTLHAGNIIPTVSNVTTIGTSVTKFNAMYATTFFGTAVTANYADLAEYYAGDKIYDPGTVVVFGGVEEVTTTTLFADVSVAGVVSTNPAYIMNDQITSANPVAIALRGRVPVKVVGPVNKGDLLVASSTEGFAESVGREASYGVSIFAKAIETNLDLGEKVIIAVIL